MQYADGNAGGGRVEKFDGSEGRVHFIVLDACDASAAEVADVALHTIRALLWLGLTPAEVFASLNEVLLDLYERQHGTTVGSGAILTLDMKRLTATFASAGRSHWHHVSTGPVFGAARDAAYKDERFPYPLGRLLLFLTDGLLDIRRSDGTRGHVWHASDICNTIATYSIRRCMSFLRNTVSD